MSVNEANFTTTFIVYYMQIINYCLTENVSLSTFIFLASTLYISSVWHGCVRAHVSVLFRYTSLVNFSKA